MTPSDQTPDYGLPTSDFGLRTSDHRALPAGRITQIAGRAIVLRGDDIDTDRIMPARFLRALTFDGLGEHVFEDDRAEAAAGQQCHPFDTPGARDASILVVNRNFGCGSSREHAPQGLLRRGIRAIVGESFSEIFFGNATALGVPCVTTDAAAVRALMKQIDACPGLVVTVDLVEMLATVGPTSVAVHLPAGVRQALLDGTWDATGLLMERYDEVRAVAARLPYVNAFPGL